MRYESIGERVTKCREQRDARQDALIDVLQARFRDIPQDLTRILKSLSDLEQLQALTRFAATVENLELFQRQLLDQVDRGVNLLKNRRSQAAMSLRRGRKASGLGFSPQHIYEHRVRNTLR